MTAIDAIPPIQKIHSEKALEAMWKESIQETKTSTSLVSLIQLMYKIQILQAHFMKKTEQAASKKEKEEVEVQTTEVKKSYQSKKIMWVQFAISGLYVGTAFVGQGATLAAKALEPVAQLGPSWEQGRRSIIELKLSNAKTKSETHKDASQKQSQLRQQAFQTMQQIYESFNRAKAGFIR